MKVAQAGQCVLKIYRQLHRLKLVNYTFLASRKSNLEQLADSSLTEHPDHIFMSGIGLTPHPSSSMTLTDPFHRHLLPLRNLALTPSPRTTDSRRRRLHHTRRHLRPHRPQRALSTRGSLSRRPNPHEQSHHRHGRKVHRLRHGVHAECASPRYARGILQQRRCRVFAHHTWTCVLVEAWKAGSENDDAEIRHESQGLVLR